MRPTGRTGLIVGGVLSSCAALLAACSSRILLATRLCFWVGFLNLFLKCLDAAHRLGDGARGRGEGARPMMLSSLWLGLGRLQLLLQLRPRLRLRPRLP